MKAITFAPCTHVGSSAEQALNEPDDAERADSASDDALDANSTQPRARHTEHGERQCGRDQRGDDVENHWRSLVAVRHAVNDAERRERRATPSPVRTQRG